MTLREMTIFLNFWKDVWAFLYICTIILLIWQLTSKFLSDPLQNNTRILSDAFEASEKSLTEYCLAAILFLYVGFECLVSISFERFASDLPRNFDIAIPALRCCFPKPESFIEN